MEQNGREGVKFNFFSQEFGGGGLRNGKVMEKMPKSGTLPLLEEVEGKGSGVPHLTPKPLNYRSLTLNPHHTISNVRRMVTEGSGILRI